MSDAANNQKPRNRWIPLVAAVAFFSCCGCPTFFTFVPYKGPRSVERLEADLEERLPDGSTREHAEAWFASHGFQSNDILSGYTGKRVGRMTIIPNPTLFENAEIRIEVYFDENDRVRKRVIYRFVYSL